MTRSNHEARERAAREQKATMRLFGAPPVLRYEESVAPESAGTLMPAHAWGGSTSKLWSRLLPADVVGSSSRTFYDSGALLVVRWALLLSLATLLLLDVGMALHVVLRTLR